MLGNTGENLYKLQKCQNRTCRIILYRNLGVSTEEMHNELKIDRLSTRYKYRGACLVYKSMNNMSPKYISDLFIPISEYHCYPTSCSENDNVYIEKKRLSICQRAFSVQGGTIWNDLPSYVKTAASLMIFKARCKEFLGMQM